MAIARTAGPTATAEVALNSTTSFTVPLLGVEKVLVLRIWSVNYTGLLTSSSFAPTYNGVPLTAINYANASSGGSYLFSGNWILIAPPEGVAYTLALGGPSAYVGGYCIESFSGVDQKSPYGSFLNSGGQSVNGSFNHSLSSQTNNWDLDTICVYWTSTLGNTGSQTTDYGYAGSGYGRAGWFSHQNGATTSTFTYSESNGVQYCVYAMVGLRPSTAVRGRGVYYNIDVWDPQRRILDPNGRIVKPWEVEPNHWGRIAGLFLPTPDKPVSYVEDPELFFIEGTDYSDDTASLKIETSRGQLGEVMLRRAVAGSSG